MVPVRSVDAKSLFGHFAYCRTCDGCSANYVVEDCVSMYPEILSDPAQDRLTDFMSQGWG